MLQAALERQASLLPLLRRWLGVPAAAQPAPLVQVPQRPGAPPAGLPTKMRTEVESPIGIQNPLACQRSKSNDRWRTSCGKASLDFCWAAVAETVGLILRALHSC